MANTSGIFNIGLGLDAGINVTTASNVIAIGIRGPECEQQLLYWPDLLQRAATSLGPTPTSLQLSSDGRLGGLTSHRADINMISQPMEKASEAILRVQAGSFRYTRVRRDPDNRQFGLIAEEVAEVAPTWWDATRKANRNPFVTSSQRDVAQRIP